MSRSADEERVATDSSVGRSADSTQRTRSVTHALLVVLFAFAAAAVMQEVWLTVMNRTGVADDGSPLLMQVVPMALHFAGFLVVCGAYLHWRSDRELFLIARPSQRDIRWILLGFSGLVALLVGFDILLSQVGLEPAENASVEVGMENPQLFLYFIPVVLLLNAPAEELLFRGVVQGLFRRAYGVVPGILVASLVFGLVHYVALVGTGSRLSYVGIAFVSGLVLGGLYEYTENLLVPIAVHACWNSLVYLNLYLHATGTI